MSDFVKCPSCSGQLSLSENSCPHCGRWMAVRGFTFYAFWIALSLVVATLIVYFFHNTFVVLTRML